MPEESRNTNIRLDEVESEESLLTSPKPESPSAIVASRFHKWSIGNILAVVVDFVTIGFSLLFLAYGVAVKVFEGTIVEGSSQVRMLEQASRLVSDLGFGLPLYGFQESSSGGPTIYPILFAAVVGKALRSIAFWKLEKGSRVGILDQLLGSMTIFQAVMTQIQMRTLSFMGIWLVLVWTLSPLGGQASLRVIGRANQTTTTFSDIRYINPTSRLFDQFNNMSTRYVGSYANAAFSPVNALFGAAMINSATSKSQAVDAWGNPKIPWLEYLDDQTQDQDGWIHVTTTDSSDGYVSLIGISLSEISSRLETKTTFNLETSYLLVKCPFLGEDSTFIDSMNKHASASAINLGLYSGIGRTTEQSNGMDEDMTSRNFSYYDTLEVVANCTIETSYVEVSINCSVGSCLAVKMRRSQISHPPAAWTVLDSPDPATWSFWEKPFITALGGGHSAMPSPYQKFILNPQDAFNSALTAPDVTTVGTLIFSVRLGQLLNTFWSAMLAPTAVPKGLGNKNLTADTEQIRGSLQQTARATIIQQTLVSSCNMAWLIILIVSSAVTALLGICGLVAFFCRRGPDLGFNVACCIKDSPFIKQPVGPSTLDAGDRTRFCKNAIVKYGDVRGEDEYGYIAIGDGDTKTLSSRRLCT